MKMNRILAKWSLLSLTLTNLTLFSNSTSAQEAFPNSMGLMGDSISAGMLARWKRQDVNNPFTLLDIIINGGFAMATQDVTKVEARDYSWSTGQSKKWIIPTHALRIEALKGEKVKAINVAISGQKVDEVLNQQLSNLRMKSMKDLKRKFPEYVTLLIGANDICAKSANEMTSVSAYHAKIESITAQILEESPDTKILISGLPNITKLQDVARNEKTFGKTCGQMWAENDFCSTLMTITEPLERDAISQRVRDFNMAIQDVVDNAKEVHGDRVRMASKVYDTDFNANDLSPDCFHPNEIGQGKLAAMSFASTWWSNDWDARGESAFKRKQKVVRQREFAERRSRMGH